MFWCQSSWCFPFIQHFNEGFVSGNFFLCTLSAMAPNKFKEWFSRRKHQLLIHPSFFLLSTNRIGGWDGKESTWNVGDLGLTLELGRSPGGGHEWVAHSSILTWRIPMDRGAWRATVHGVAKSQPRLSKWAQHGTNLNLHKLPPFIERLAHPNCAFPPSWRLLALSLHLVL